MPIVRDLAQIAVECAKPGRESIWSPELGKYVCRDSEEGKRALLQSGRPPLLYKEGQHPALGQQFKLVVLISFALTVLFLVLCVVLTLVAGKEPPPLHDKIVMGLFDLVKISTGTLLGLLGGKMLQA